MIDLRAAKTLLRERGVREIALVGCSLGGHAVLASSFEGDVECVVSVSAPVLETPDELSRRVTGRKLFICADGDTTGRVIPHEHVRRAFELADGPKTLLVFGGAEHSRGMFAAPVRRRCDQGDRRLRRRGPLMPARVNPDVPGEPPLARRVGARIRALRKKKGLTMADLGSDRRGRVYFEKQYVWKMETGRVTPSLAALSHIAKRLGVRLSTLLRGL